MSVLLTLELLDKLREIRRVWKINDGLPPWDQSYSAPILDECILLLEETERAVDRDLEEARKSA